MDSQWHALDINQVAERFNTDIQNGLSNEEASRRLIKRGTRSPRTKPSRSRLIADVHSIIYLSVLVISSIILALTGSWFEAGITLLFASVSYAVVIVVRYYSYYSIHQTPSPPYRVKVIRDGKVTTVDESDIVPGDLILFEKGDRMPADIRITKSDGIKVDQRAILPDNPISTKGAGVCDSEALLAERFNMLYFGSFVLRGKGQGIVVAVGEETAFPEAISSLNESDTQITVEDIVTKSLPISVVIGIGIFIALWLLKMGVSSSLMFGSGFIISSFPYLLPAATMGIIAYVFRRINRDYGIIKNLSVMDTLNRVTAICVEREWGITESVYAIDMAFIDNRLMTKSELVKPIAVVEKMEDEPADDENGRTEDQILADDIRLFITAAYYSLNTRWNDGKLIPILGGHQFDAEIERFSYEISLPMDEYLSTLQKVSALNDPDGQFRSVVMRDPAGHLFTFMAGEIEEVANKCTHILSNGMQEGIAGENRETIRTVAGHLEQEGIRVLAIAYGLPLDVEPGDYDSEKAEFGLTFLGLLGLRNPIRKDIPQIIAQYRGAGTRVIMMSDDDPEFASELAASIGLIPAKSCYLNDEDIKQMTDQQLDEQLDHVSLYVSLSPESKDKVIRALQVKGNKVAVLSAKQDDLQSFKSADVRVSSLHQSSDLLRKESDIVLKGGGLDSFASVFSFVRSGFLGVIGATRWILSSHIGQGLAFLISFILVIFWRDGFDLPMKIKQIIWLNFWSIAVPSFGLMADIKPVTVRYRPLQVRDEITGGHRIDIVLRGIVLALMALLAGVLTLELGRYDQLLNMRFRTSVTTLFLLAQLLFIFQCHRRYGESLLARFFSNRLLIALVFISIAAHITAIYLPPLANLLEFSPIGLEWTWIGVLCLIPLLPLTG